MATHYIAAEILGHYIRLCGIRGAAVTSVPAFVTCKHCLRLMAQQEQASDAPLPLFQTQAA